MPDCEFTMEKPRIADKKTVTAPWMGEPRGKHFRCHLCGHKFVVGDTYRLLFCQGPEGNCIVCEPCYGPDVKKRWAALYAEGQDRFWWMDRRGA